MQPSSEPLHAGALTELVPAAGLRWMVVGRPADLFADTELASLVAPLLPEARLDAFAEGTGVDLRETPAALAAGFDLGTLYLARTPWPNLRIERRFIERSFREPRRQSPHPRVTRLTSVIGNRPQMMVRVHSELVAVAVGDPTPARAVELFALGKLRRSPSALRGSSLRTLPDFSRAPLRFYAPGPFSGEWAKGAGGLLAGSLAVGAALEPEGRRARVTVVLSGDFEPAADVSRLLSAWDELARSPLGHLLGLSEVGEPQVDIDAGLLRLRLSDIDLLPIARGLHAAVAADVWDMMDLSSPPADRESGDSDPQ